jgi:hypothetical protein
VPPIQNIARLVHRVFDRVQTVFDFERVHQPRRFLRVVGHLAAIKIGRDADEAVAGVAARDVFDVVGQTPPLVNQNNCLRAFRALIGQRDKSS